MSLPQKLKKKVDDQTVSRGLAGKPNMYVNTVYIILGIYLCKYRTPG